MESFSSLIAKVSNSIYFVKAILLNNFLVIRKYVTENIDSVPCNY